MNRASFIRISALAALSGTMACTGQIPGSIRLAQQEEAFDAQGKIDINTKIDLLWVVDNSASMDVSQAKLRAGFAGFAAKYMKPTWDIRAAVITTDTYLANPAFSGYLNSKISGNGTTSAYINGRLATWNNPAYNSTLYDKVAKKFQNGVRYKDMWPAVTSNYAKLLPGLHDGPIPALCYEGHSYFFAGETNCRIRDNQTAYSGPDHCLNPASGETSLTQCVNTAENDTIHSGKAIISTMPPTGTPGDATWTNQLINDFMVNVTTGAAGAGSERGLASLQQLLADNETSPSAFFRPGSLRGIIFVSDEDDQSLPIPAAPAAGFSPFTGYVAPCPSKTVDGYTYQLSSCPDATQLIPVATIKNQVDTFFKALDSGATDPNYFVVSIVAADGASIQALQAARAADDNAAGNPGNVATDRGDRYIQFGALVGNGSMVMNIADNDYSPILDAIGTAIISKKSTFTLTRAPNVNEQVVVKIQHADSSITTVPTSSYTVSGKTLTITDYSVVLGFAATDKILINYQPNTVY